MALRSPRWGALFVVFLMAGPNGLNAQEELRQATASQEAIAAAWDQQAANMPHSAEVRWRKVTTFWPGSLISERDEEGSYPPSKTEIESHAVVFIDGDNIRFELRGAEWSTASARFVDDCTYLFLNGSHDCRHFHGRPLLDDIDHHTGFLCPLDMRSKSTVPTMLWPLMIVLRKDGLFAMSHRDAMWRIVGSDSADNVLIEIDGGSIRQRWWCDPKNAYRIVRATTELPASTSTVATSTPLQPVPDAQEWFIRWQYDLKYDSQDGGPLRLSGWRFTERAVQPNSVRRIDDVEIERWTLNHPIDEKQFAFDFPPGTVVTDHRHKNVERYLVNETGEKRLITPSELANPNNNYQVLRNTKSGDAVSASPPRRSSTLGVYVVLNAIVFLIVVVYFYRRIRRRQNQRIDN